MINSLDVLSMYPYMTQTKLQPVYDLIGSELACGDHAMTQDGLTWRIDGFPITVVSGSSELMQGVYIARLHTVPHRVTPTATKYSNPNDYRVVLPTDLVKIEKTVIVAICGQ